MDYDGIYSQIENLFGKEPEEMLRDHIHRLDRSRPVLDVGAGQGRNTLFLARQGFSVDALEPSEAALRKIATRVKRENLKVRTYAQGFETFQPQEDVYTGILLFGILQILSWESISVLSDKIAAWAGPGGLLFITAFTREDPSFSRCQREWDRVDRNSFSDGKGNIRTFLETDEVLTLFKGFKTLHHWEGLGAVHHHGTGVLEQHVITEAVLIKVSKSAE